jgi:hypothetical protein
VTILSQYKEESVPDQAPAELSAVENSEAPELGGRGSPPLG